MDLNSELILKEELLSFEDDVDILNYDFDVKVKVENQCYSPDYIQDGDIIKSPECYVITTSYDELSKNSRQTCFLCCKFFSSSFNLLQHNLEHFKVPLVRWKLCICDYCPKYFNNKKDLEAHILTDHTQTQKTTGKIKQTLHKCKICDKHMSYKRWHNHMNEVHTAQRHKCDKCDVQFKCKRYLKRHILYTHNGSRPKWRFPTNPLQAKDIKCPICPAAFYNASALLTHKRACHYGKICQCQICKKIFKCEAYLSTHINRVHYDDGSEYRCDICGKIFKSPRYLKIHQKNSHKVVTVASKPPTKLSKRVG